MRASAGVMLIVFATGTLAACGNSPTAPEACIDHTTSSSYVELQSIVGTITTLSDVQGSSGTTRYEVIQIGPEGSGAGGIFTVNASTAVFERVGASPPSAASICRLAVGERVQVSTGFGDVVDILVSDGSSAPLPPLLGQIVILR